MIMTRRQFLNRSGMMALAVVASPVSYRPSASLASEVNSRVLTSEGMAVSNARITLFRPDLTFFRETRADETGQYMVPDVPSGTYRLGACAPGREYREVDFAAGEQGSNADFLLGADQYPGEWTVIGNTEPETFGGTNSGSLMSDGRVFFCHDTIDPILFDPVTGMSSQASSSGSEQGCHMPTSLLDGRLLFVGGGTVDDAGNFSGGEHAVKLVKAYDPLSDTWEQWPDLNEPRWYPGLARLADGKLLLFGGGQQPDRIRTASCEILDPQIRQSTMTGSMIREGGFGPTALLYTGEVLVTWQPPQLYNPVTGQWRATGQFVQPNRAEVPEGHPPAHGSLPAITDHPDHSAIFLPDGRVVAIGIRRLALGNPGSMVEIYDPATEMWSLLSSPDTIRSMPEVLMLPTGKILVAGGHKEDPNSPDPVNEWGFLKRADLYDPAADTWQRMADMGDFREYHATTLLLPDGRVLTTAGTRQPGVNPPPNSNKNIEAFSPPYLFRGVRPRIEGLSSERFTNGEAVTINVSFTRAVTSIVLIGMNAISHWMDGGVSRLLQLDLSQIPTQGFVDGTQVTARIPADRFVAPAGYYLLFALVDDIPSEGHIVSIT